MVTVALLMGFAGSLHCVGMCSPLAIAASNLTPTATLNRLVYNAGRILTYGVLGLLAGAAGSVLHFADYQNLLSIVLGVVMLSIAFFGISGIRIPLVTPWVAQLTTRIKIVFSVFFRKKNHAAVFTLGALNGVLPCGLTVIALAYASTLANPITSMYSMLLFGIGTLPVMLGLTSFFQYLISRFKLNFKKVTTTMLVVSGCMLIARVFIFNHAHASPEEQQVVDIILCR